VTSSNKIAVSNIETFAKDYMVSKKGTMEEQVFIEMISKNIIKKNILDGCQYKA
jgi:hypothetical protein